MKEGIISTDFMFYAEDGCDHCVEVFDNEAAAVSFAKLTEKVREVWKYLVIRKLHEDTVIEAVSCVWHK